MKRTEAVSQIEQIVAPVAEAAGLEIVDIDLKGSGRHQMLQIVIDKPGGVTHADCELITREAGERIDAADPISGPYQMEVSSPGVERALKKWKDWERFVGQKVKVVLKEPLAMPDQTKPVELKHFDGVVTSAENQSVTVELTGGEQVTFPFDQVSRANLKFEW
jgi:ribosome maturation factor RimP